MSQFAAEIRELVDDLVRRGADGERAALWAQLRELGLPRVGVGEALGGSGGTFDDLLVLVAALAGHGVGQPVIEASAADWVLSHAGPLDERFSTLVLLDGPLDHALTGDGTLHVELASVPWARDADRLVICAPGAGPVVVDLDHPSVTVRPGDDLAGDPRDTVLLVGTPAAEIDAAPGYGRIRARTAVLWSTAVTGAAQGAYRLTKSYVSERQQFGAPLLKIPAVAGGLALMRVELIQADAALAHARDAGVSADTAAIARIVTARTATAVARAAHQLHGAMGVTEEYPLHRFTRRLWAWRDAVDSERRWAEDLGGRAADAGESGVWTRLTDAGG
ncbi:acyl-CoA dehydrogenase family protein [Streptomyces sp. NPDC020965]|uniref:acyl-CoA dehydrogenase family protein n=1 Tax=Streptomyces sp. NPDC020965 TaxID=3365105 RepID=UPI0037A5F0F0